MFSRIYSHLPINLKAEEENAELMKRITQLGERHE
jgi:hypothetical protein